MSRPSQAGFTLVEVMVALAIVAIALVGAGTVLAQNSKNVFQLRDRTLAVFIASNEIAEVRLSRQYPDVGRSTREIEFGRREWIIETVVSESGIDGLRRLDVSVLRPADETNIRTVSGFVSRAQAPPAVGVPAYSQLDEVEDANRQ
ncbi:MAG: type II secretion system minor pseudopilin GspI [Pseudomonadota bacterium]